MKTSTLALGLLASFFCVATAASSCATSTSDGDETDEEDGETEETEEEDGCSASQFECGSGECISSTYECDGTPQCEDGSDEPPTNTECPQSNCLPAEFECSPDQCIAQSLFCDGFLDCDNGSDEVANCDVCTLPNPTPPKTCDMACNTLYDCGFLTCPGGQLCDAFTGAAGDRAEFIAACNNVCQTQSVLIEITNPSDCNSSIQFMMTEPTLGATCTGEAPPKP